MMMEEMEEKKHKITVISIFFQFEHIIIYISILQKTEELFFPSSSGFLHLEEEQYSWYYLLLQFFFSSTSFFHMVVVKQYILCLM